jgi:hypothetical protein
MSVAVIVAVLVIVIMSNFCDEIEESYLLVCPFYLPMERTDIYRHKIPMVQIPAQVHGQAGIHSRCRADSQADADSNTEQTQVLVQAQMQDLCRYRRSRKFTCRPTTRLTQTDHQGPRPGSWLGLLLGSLLDSRRRLRPRPYPDPDASSNAGPDANSDSGNQAHNQVQTQTHAQASDQTHVQADYQIHNQTHTQSDDHTHDQILDQMQAQMQIQA